MSVNTGYDQYLRKYRLLVKSRSTVKVAKAVKTVSTEPDVPVQYTGVLYTGTVTANSLNVRYGPGTKYKSIAKLKKGTSVDIVLKSGSWYKIVYKNKKSNNGMAWVQTQYIKKTGKKKKKVTSVSGVETQIKDKVLDVSDLRCTFKCEKSVSDTPNYSEIVVYNLNESTISGIKAGNKVILEAGYEGGNYGMIFTGDIVQPYVTRESATDTALHLVVQDGDAFLNSAFVMTTLAKACTNADVVRSCMDGDVSEGLLTNELEATAMPRGKVMFGKSSYYVKKAALGVSGQFYIEDGKINIVSATDYASNKAVELNPRTGLIDMPGQTEDGVSAKCLINPSIKLNTLVHIDSSLVAQKTVSSENDKIKKVSKNGVYRIIKLTYSGDTHGDDWYCEFEAVEQSGKKPTGMKNGVVNPWR